MTEGLRSKVEPGYSPVNSLLDRACFQRGAAFFHVHREAHLSRVVPSILIDGMTLAGA